MAEHPLPRNWQPGRHSPTHVLHTPTTSRQVHVHSSDQLCSGACLLIYGCYAAALFGQFNTAAVRALYITPADSIQKEERIMVARSTLFAALPVLILAALTHPATGQVRASNGVPVRIVVTAVGPHGGTIPVLNREDV